MKKSIALGMAALAVTGTAGIASAKSKPKPPPVPPVCNMVTDPAGDTFLLRSQDTQKVYGPQEDALDLISEDIASDAKTVTAVFRVKKLATSAATAPSGLSYEMDFTAGTSGTLYFSAYLNGTTATYDVGTRASSTSATSLGTPVGVVDLTKSEIRISAPVALFNGQGTGFKPGSKITMSGLDQTASRGIGAAGASLSAFADVASGDKVYLAGNPSCVVVGK